MPKRLSCLSAVHVLLRSMQTATLAIRVSKAELLALRKHARLAKLSQGEVIRRSLRASGITAPDPAAPARTGYDAIKHLIGRNRGGPADLSTNPRHLDGYGA
jgi:hypothetical protein